MSPTGTFGNPMAAQFRPYRGGYVYRPRNKGPAIPVTREEHARFLRFYVRMFFVDIIVFMAAVIGAAVVVDQVFPGKASVGGFVLMGAFMVAIIAGLFGLVAWTMRAPARALRGRAPIPWPPPDRLPGRLPG